MHALVVIDVQNDFCPGGALAVTGGDEIVAPINAMMAEFDAVILTQDWHPAGHSSFASQHPGKAPLEMRVPISGDDPVVVMLQEDGYGPILAAARLR